jgi:hypothetical protein
MPVKVWLMGLNRPSADALQIDPKALRKTAVRITIIPVARGLPQALAAVRDCVSTARFWHATKEVRPRLTIAVP